MPSFQCEICDSYQVFSNNIPDFCPKCGTQKGPWKKIREEIKIKFGDKQYIIYKDQEFGRKEIKTFFSELIDDEGNQVYKYCDPDKPMLFFIFDVDGKIFVKANTATKNSFLLNEKKIEEEKLIVKKNDKLNLCSSSQNKIITSFEIL